MAFFSFAIAIASARFIGAGFDAAFAGFADHLLNRRMAFIAHVTAAPAALLIGSVQMFPKLRNKYKHLHRWLGRCYAIAVLIAGVSGLIIAVSAQGGIVAQTGFGFLAVAWLLTTTMAVKYAVHRNIGLHRRWIIRSFALTFAAVTLRIYLPFFIMNGFTYAEGSNFVAWLCWVPNLMFAEWWLRRAKV